MAGGKSERNIIMAAYNNVYTLVSPTGVHTNHIESYWKEQKRIHGCHTSQLPSYLDEFMWRERYGKNCLDVLDNIYGDIAQWYPSTM